MGDFDANSFLRAARHRIAVHGIGGLSLRRIAQDAGASPGALSYHIGDKATLMARLIDAEIAARHARYGAWQARAAPLDPTCPQTLAAIVTAWLDEAASSCREDTAMACELVLEAGIARDGLPGMSDLFDAEDRFWAGLLGGGRWTAAEPLGKAIAAYCRDELPFTLALAADADYRLLRAATISRLAAGFAGDGAGIARHFDALVDACGQACGSSLLPVDLPDGSRKAELAQHIAVLIMEQGIAALSHRAVAARAGVSNSNVAHHFRTSEDLLYAGMGGLIQRMRRELRSPPGQRWHHGLAVIRATHAIALAAARDPALRPFALDMRRRRAENVRMDIAAQIGVDVTCDGAAVQAATMVLIGSGLARQADDARQERGVITAHHVAALRQSRAGSG